MSNHEEKSNNEWLSFNFVSSSSSTLTEVCDVVAGGVECAGVELEPDDGEDDDGEEQEQRDVHQRTDRLQDRRNHDLQAWKRKGNEI